FAAYSCLVDLFPAGAARLAAVMTSYGYALNDTTTPANIGNATAQAVIQARIPDGSNQHGDLNPGAGPYGDYTGYTPRNAAMAYCIPSMPVCAPVDVFDPNHWQPLIGPPLPDGSPPPPQTCVAPHWELVDPFALTSADQFDYLAPMPPDVFKNDGHY